MTEETQALTRYALHFHYGDDDAWMVTADDGEFVRYDAAAAALTSLARDLETARQERDAALANCKNWWKLRAELATKQNDTLCAERDAAVRAARAETWAEAALLAGQSATAIRHMRQAFVASPVMGELAVVRAEALEQFAKGLHERATAAREGQ